MAGGDARTNCRGKLFPSSANAAKMHLSETLADHRLTAELLVNYKCGSAGKACIIWMNAGENKGCEWILQGPGLRQGVIMRQVGSADHKSQQDDNKVKYCVNAGMSRVIQWSQETTTIPLSQ